MPFQERDFNWFRSSTFEENSLWYFWIVEVDICFFCWEVGLCGVGEGVCSGFLLDSSLLLSVLLLLDVAARGEELLVVRLDILDKKPSNNPVSLFVNEEERVLFDELDGIIPDMINATQRERVN